MRARLREFGTGLLVALAAADPLVAGEFSVNPVRLELGAAARSGAVEVRNEGSRDLGFQIDVKEWIQDAQGKDQYLDTADIVFFPKIMTVAPGQDRVIRVGAKAPVTATERTYRLFIEELPSNVERGPAKGAQINLLIRFGAPIFVGPVRPQDALALDQVALAQGELTLAVQNSGNRHQVIEGIHLRGVDAAGQQSYAATLADRYLLAGARKTFRSTIPQDRCVRLASIDVEVKTNRGSARQTVPVTPRMCAPA